MKHDKLHTSGSLPRLVRLRLRFLNWLSLKAFAFSEWCEHLVIGGAVIQAYRHRGPFTLELIAERRNELNSISQNMGALDTLGRMHRQVERESKEKANAQAMASADTQTPTTPENDH